VLDERQNQFYVKSKDIYSKKSVQSKLYDVTYINQPPTLEITSPQDGKKYYEPNISIEGETDKEIFVKINNMPVVIKADGTFSYPHTLNKGENKINVVAVDLAGNTTEKTLNVVYFE
jgi:bacillopeptidase F